MFNELNILLYRTRYDCSYSICTAELFQTLMPQSQETGRKHHYNKTLPKETFFAFFLDNITLGEHFSVELTFRTSTRDGILFVILGNSTTEAGELIRCPKLCLIPSQQIKNRERERELIYERAEIR